MQVSTETFLHLVLSPEEGRQVVREFQELMTGDVDIKWSEYPALDELSDRICRG